VTKLINLEEVKDFAIQAHGNQLDKSGQPYIEHPLWVGRRLASYGILAQAGGYLHDTVEDTNVSLQDIRDRFGDVLADIVLSVTRLDPTYNHRLLPYAAVDVKEIYRDSIFRAKANPIGRLIKSTDVYHNTLPERLNALPEAGRGMVRRYAMAFEILAPEELGLNYPKPIITSW
jgi:(p)ppGpp synthase/HD superfamily hydrolase